MAFLSPEALLPGPLDEPVQLHGRLSVLDRAMLARLDLLPKPLLAQLFQSFLLTIRMLVPFICRQVTQLAPSRFWGIFERLKVVMNCVAHYFDALQDLITKGPGSLECDRPISCG